MKRVLIFLILCISSIGMCFAADYNTVILPSSYIKKSDNSILYSRNLEEMFANELIKNLAGTKKFTTPSTTTLKHTLRSNPQLNSILEQEEKVKILAKIYGANRVLNITIKYEIKSLNTAQNSKMLEKVALITDNTFIRLTTKVNLINISDNKTLWSNVYCKNVNFETLSNKNITPITNYYEKLSQNIINEIKTQSNIRPVDYKQQAELELKETPELPKVEIHHVTPKIETPKNTSIKPQLQLKEDLSEKKTVVKQSDKKSVVKQTKKKNNSEKKKFNIKNIQLKLKPSTPPKEVKPEDIKTKPQSVQPTYTNIHVTPRKNSRNYTPQFNNSINDI